MICSQIPLDVPELKSILPMVAKMLFLEVQGFDQFVVDTLNWWRLGPAETSVV